MSGAHQRLLAWLGVVVCVLLLAGANAYLVYMATTTQPACVAHARSGADAAAKSSCRTQ